MTSRPKFRYVRSLKLLEACRRLECQHCGRRDGTVCAAHSNWAVHGKGRSIKASDIYVAAMCHQCHSQLDQGRVWSEAQRRQFWWLAHQLTILRLQRDRLWPSTVPLPDISAPPGGFMSEEATP